MRPLNGLGATDFYRLRDQRTSTVLCDVDLSKTTVRIGISEADASTFAGQLTFLLTTNLSARWCRSIALVAPRVEVVPELNVFGYGDLLEAAQTLARRADPFGSFTAAEFSGDVAAEVHIGRDSSAHAIFGAGWQCAIGDGTLDLVPDCNNPLGPALAAAMATSDLLVQIFRGFAYSGTTIDLWDLPSSPQTIVRTEIGRVLMAGAGAVGSSMAALWPLLQLQAEIVVLDLDRLDYSNMNRSPIFYPADWNHPKVKIVSDFLTEAGVQSTPVFENYRDSRISASDFDLVIPAADEHGVRWTIQSQLPPVMSYGSTGSQWDAHGSRHIPGRDDCLACRYPSVQPKTECAKGVLDPTSASGDEQRSGALPHLSLLAAVLALSQVVKLAHGYVSKPNHEVLFTATSSPRICRWPRSPSATCPKCMKFDPEIWRAIHAGRRFAGLSANQILSA
jgi:molybdopterin/thiamine biosynthesis adenylyltransferase